MMHTKGEWIVWSHRPKDGHYIRLSFAGVDIAVVPENGEEGEANARLVAAACNSYDKHCGSHAIEAAEDDLLGEALFALKSALEALEKGDIKSACACLDIYGRCALAKVEDKH
jgi:hypothetical protein